MVTDQFSSSDGVDDIFSKLPEDIMHFILGCLHCNKEMVRSSAISKSWLQAWRTFPVLDFNLDDFVSRSSSLARNRSKVEAKSKQFIRYVDNRLQRFQRKNGDGMIAFNLSTVNKMAYHANRWISMALDYKFEHLFICIFFMDSSMLPCLIPDRALSASWLKSLKLNGPAICIPLTECSRVDLPLLTYLHVENSDIPDEQLQKLLRGCPILEDIALLGCEFLSKVDIFDHPNLETLKVTVSSIKAYLTAIRVRAPKLKSFGYTCICLNRNVVVKIHNSPELKNLKICDGMKSDEWFHNFIAQFPLIENLIIDSCNALRKIRVSIPSLEKISINICNNLEDVVINCKKLESLLLFTVQYSIPKPSIQFQMDMDNPPNCKAHIMAPSWCALPMMNASWYGKLKEFLKRSFTFKSVTIIVQALSDVDGYMKGEDMHKKLPLVACNIGKLKLVVTGTAPPSCYSHMLNGLLSACHPTTLKLDVTLVKHFVKLVCEELGNISKRKRQCYCEDEFKCWKHQLKEVKIEKIKGIKLDEDLDWDVLSIMLPLLERGNHIYFKLRW